MVQKTNKSKAKGGAYERKVAKELSGWMFNDNNILKRHPTSGADKCIWSGDVVPLAQLPPSWNSHWPFFVETKSGYTNHTPDLLSYTKLEEWMGKALVESKDHNQHIILLITQFKNKRPLLTTNKSINNMTIEPMPRSVLPFKINGIMWCYVYDYNDLLKNYLFADLYNINDICTSLLNEFNVS